MPKKQSRRSIISPLALLLVFGLSVFLAGMEAKKQYEAEYFSAESLQSFRSLNYEYGVVIEDLTEKEASPLIAELLTANALIDQKEEPAHRGLVATLEDDRFFQLTPVNPLSDEDLEGLADAYKNIAEVEFVELDSDITLTGEPVYYNEGELLELAEEAVVNEEVIAEEEVVLEPIVIGLVDSGTYPHSAFSEQLLNGFDTFGQDGAQNDENGHGTHLAGIIASQMPGVEIAPYKIVNSQGGRLSNVISAFDQAIEDEVDIINASFVLGSSSYALEKLVEEAYEAGIVIVAAAGNNGSSADYYPAAYEHTISVASVDSTGKRLPKSNWGNIDVAAFGFSVYSTLPNDTWGRKSGTSQAAASISAAVARVMVENGLAEDLSFEEIVEGLAALGQPIEEGELAGASLIQ